jgi:hypothetical protein
MADLNSKFILFNNIIINTMHIRWCENVQRSYGETGTFGIKIVVNTGSGCETFYKWFNTQTDRDKEFKYLYDNTLRAFVV